MKKNGRERENEEERKEHINERKRNGGGEEAEEQTHDRTNWECPLPSRPSRLPRARSHPRRLDCRVRVVLFMRVTCWCMCLLTTVETGGKIEGTNVESVMLCYVVPCCVMLVCFFVSTHS